MGEIVPSLIVSYWNHQSQTTSIKTRIKQIRLQLQIKHSDWIKMQCVFSQRVMSDTAVPRPKPEPKFYVPTWKCFISIQRAEKKHLRLLLQHFWCVLMTIWTVTGTKGSRKVFVRSLKLKIFFSHVNGPGKLLSLGFVVDLLDWNAELLTPGEEQIQTSKWKHKISSCAVFIFYMGN